MNTARIVALAIAVGAGGIAACLAIGSDNLPMRAGPVAQLHTDNPPATRTGTPLEALAAKDRTQRPLRLAAAADQSGDQAARHGDRIILADDGVQGATAQHGPKGRSI